MAIVSNANATSPTCIFDIGRSSTGFDTKLRELTDRRNITARFARMAERPHQDTVAIEPGFETSILNLSTAFKAFSEILSLDLGRTFRRSSDRWGMRPYCHFSAFF